MLSSPSPSPSPPPAPPSALASLAVEQRAAQHVGIHAMEVYVPKKFVDQAELETFDGVSAGKYTIGLGQTRMAVCDDREDIHSICLTAVQSLMEKYNIPPSDIGRLEVGTETIIDKSKSVKSVLMTLFQDSGNTEIEGVDTTNACYGGTNALFNAIHWVESSYWDGRYALVVAGDIAVYRNGSARPTGGAGVVAMLVGAYAPLVFDSGLRGTHMAHAYDFYKPDLHSEYPEVDGPLSNRCYIRAVDICYQRYMDRLKASMSLSLMEEGSDNSSNIKEPSTDSIDYFAFHSPYTKLVQKSFSRMVLNDFLRGSIPALQANAELDAFQGIDLEVAVTDRAVEKAFMTLSKDAFTKKVAPSLLIAKNVGNMYCGSVFGGLASLISEVPSEVLQGKRIALFSYGSGFAASMYSITVRGSTATMARNLNLAARLASRTQIPPARFDEIMQLRERVHNMKSYTPISSVEGEDGAAPFPGTYTLVGVDDQFRRTYVRHSTVL